MEGGALLRWAPDIQCLCDKCQRLWPLTYSRWSYIAVVEGVYVSNSVRSVWNRLSAINKFITIWILFISWSSGSQYITGVKKKVFLEHQQFDRFTSSLLYLIVCTLLKKRDNRRSCPLFQVDSYDVYIDMPSQEDDTAKGREGGARQDGIQTYYIYVINVRGCDLWHVPDDLALLSWKVYMYQIQLDQSEIDFQLSISLLQYELYFILR